MDNKFPRRSAVIKEICNLLGFPESLHAANSGIPSMFFTSIASEMGIHTLQNNLETARAIVESAHLHWLPEFSNSSLDSNDTTQITTLGLLQIKNAVLIWLGLEPIQLPNVHNFPDWKPNSDWQQKRELLQREVIENVARPGASQFRELVLSIYENKCAITGNTSTAAIDVAHIVPYYGIESDVIQNAIPLRADLHRLFDCGLVKIEKRTDSKHFYILFHRDIITDYSEFHDLPLKIPIEKKYHPSDLAFEIRRNLFLENWVVQ